MSRKYVEFSFVNGEGVEKKVSFYMDKESYEAYHDPSVPEEWTRKMLIQEYREYCSEKRYKKRIIPMPTDDEGNEVDIPDNAPSIADVLIEEERLLIVKSLVKEALEKLPEKQRIAFIKIHLENKKPCVACKEMNIKKNTFSELLVRSEESFEKAMKTKKFKNFCEKYELLGVEKA